MLARAAEARGELRITGLETDLLRFSPGRPQYDAVHRFGDHRGGVVLRIRTNAEITGWAYSYFGMVEGGPEVLQTILEKSIQPLLIGEDPAFPKRIRRKLWSILEYHGVQGIAHFGIGAVDMAVWDILGKAAGLPVYKMLGAAHERMPVYSMCGWYYEDDRDLSIYKKAIEDRLEEGFRAIKVKTGRGSLEEDIAAAAGGAGSRGAGHPHHGGCEPRAQSQRSPAPGARLSRRRLLLVRRADAAAREGRLRGAWPTSSTSASRRVRTSTRSTSSWNCSSAGARTFCSRTTGAPAG